MRFIIILLTMFTMAISQSTDYKRTEFMPSGWSYSKANIRQFVLERDNKGKLVKDSEGKIISGLWVCPYCGVVLSTPDKIQIDHMVPLKEAFISGADVWTKEQKVKFAHYVADPYHLVCACIKDNTSKSDRDPSKWLPKLGKKQYIANWVAVKIKWKLTIDPAEQSVINKY